MQIFSLKESERHWKLNFSWKGMCIFFLNRSRLFKIFLNLNIKLSRLKTEF